MDSHGVIHLGEFGLIYGEFVELSEGLREFGGIWDEFDITKLVNFVGVT